MRYEFGVKASIATTEKGNVLVGSLTLPSNPYDGQSQVSALAQVQ